MTDADEVNSHLVHLESAHTHTLPSASLSMKARWQSTKGYARGSRLIGGGT